MVSRLSLINLTLFMVLLTSTSCKNDNLERDMKTFYNRKVSIPYNQMIKKDCSLYHDSVSDSHFKLVRYAEVFHCSDCQIKQLSSFDNDTYTSGVSQRIPVLYIVNIPHNVDPTELYSKLCKKRIRGTVYLDTCNAFLQANPDFPITPMFHTFLLNENDRVVLIGDPFKNKRMEDLFQMVIEKGQ
jgi:hypothetical protein